MRQSFAADYSSGALNFANAGIPVTLVDTTEDALDRGLKRIRDNYAATVAKGRRSQGDMD